MQLNRVLQYLYVMTSKEKSKNTRNKVLFYSKKSLHWLPVCQRIYFKILLLVYKALNGLDPKYISDLLLNYEPSRSLRSSGQLSVPRVRTKHSKAAFSYYAPNIWNKLPETWRSAATLTTFKSRLKTYLFAAAFN